MRHGVKKIKFSGGQDANQMLMRKLLHGFFRDGKITTTIARGKALKPLVEQLAHKVKDKTESNKNFLLRYFPNEKKVESLFQDLGAVMQKRTGGYVRLIRLYPRQSDNSMMARLEWTDPVVKQEKVEAEPKKVKATEEKKPATKKTKTKEVTEEIAK